MSFLWSLALKNTIITYLFHFLAWISTKPSTSPWQRKTGKGTLLWFCLFNKMLIPLQKKQWIWAEGKINKITIWIDKQQIKSVGQIQANKHLYSRWLDFSVAENMWSFAFRWHLSSIVNFSHLIFYSETALQD